MVACFGQVSSRPRPFQPRPSRARWRAVERLVLAALLAALGLACWLMVRDRGVVPPAAVGEFDQSSLLLQVDRLPAQVALPQATSSQEATPSSQPTSPHVTRDPSGRLSWPKVRTADRQSERDRMVDTQIAGGDLFREAVTDANVLGAMRAVPRHEFVPGRQRSAYDDTPLPIGHGQTISQPYIVALMTELLKVEPGDSILEIGTGSGYQAAVLAELTPWVYSIEIIEPLQEQAAERLARLGYVTIQTRAADGYHGWKEFGPFDGIIVTCAAGHVPPPLWDQLKPGGRMVIPLGGPFDVQRLVVLTKEPDGRRRSQTIIPVAFVPMTGQVEKP